LAVNSITDGTTTVYFFAIRGAVHGLQRSFVDESRQGEDGTAFRLLGLKPKPFELACECHVDTYAAAKTLGLLLSGLKGYVIDFVQEGITNNNCLVMEVEVAEPEMAANIRRGIYPSGGGLKNGAGAVFNCLLTLLYTADS
jgi:hypothetical protein